MTVSISPSILEESIRTGKKLTILASFWQPVEGAGRTIFRSAHIPTSLFCDPMFELSGVPSSTQGRNPLPSLTLLADSFRRWGLNTDREIIVYDHGPGIYAARAWWILKWAGIPNVRILDGGFSKWEEDNRGHAGGPGNFPHFCNVRPNPGQLPTATIDQVKAHKGLLIDARGADRFAGNKEHVDLKAGHIPGAINISSRSLLNSDNTFKSKEESREILGKHGVTSGDGIIVYSGSGNHSAQLLAIMEHCGITGAAHFLPGWSLWSANPRNPVER